MTKNKKDDRYSGVVVKCLKCGTLNPPDRVFCNNCGAKLPMNDNPFESMPRKSNIRPFIKTVSHLLSIAIIIGIAMFFWPTGPIGMDGNSRNYENFKKKTGALIRAIDEGRSYSVVLNESEVNAFLKDRINAYLEQHRFDSGTVLQEVRMMMRPSSASLQIKAKHGPVTLTRKLTVVPKIEGKEMGFDIDRVAVGVLPLPAPIADVVARRMAAVFSDAQPVKKIKENIIGIELSETKMKISVD